MTMLHTLILYSQCCFYFSFCKYALRGQVILKKCSLREFKLITLKRTFYDKSRHTAIASKTSGKWACLVITVSAPASASA